VAGQRITPATGAADLLAPCPVGVWWEPVLAGESTASVFRRSDGAVFAKCAGRRGVRHLRAERDRVAWLSATDVPCAEVADWSESADGACLVTTAIDGVRACDVPAAAVPKVLDSLAGILRDLHAVPTDRCPFDRRLSVTLPAAEDVVRRGAVDLDNLDPADRPTAPSDLLAGLRAQADLMSRLEPADLVVCHGDACLPNVLLDPDTWQCVGLVDLGRLGVADRYLDLSLVAANVGSAGMFPQFSAADADTLLRAYGLDDPDRVRLRFYQVLDALSWG
jgi:streptomycin 3"-kinase